MLCPQFRPIVGGYERAAERLSVELAARDHQVTVITERRDKSWLTRETRNSIQIVRLKIIYRPHFHMMSSLVAYALFLLHHGRRYQIWHIHQYGLHAVLALSLGKVLRRPVVLKLTSSGTQGLQRATASLPMADIARYQLLKVAAVVALTNETLLEAIAFGFPRGRIHVLGNGVDTQEFFPRKKIEQYRLRSKLDINASGVVIFVGRLSKEKNPDGLLRAWKMAISNLPKNWKLVLVGDGPMHGELRSYLDRNNLGDSVFMVGYQSNVSEWIGASDIYVLPSFWEGLSNTTLEAMACGLPVISTRVSGSAETLEDTGAGVVVDLERIDQLSDSLIRLADDQILRCQMGAVGRNVIKARYSLSLVAASHESLYRNILSIDSCDGVAD